MEIEGPARSPDGSWRLYSILRRPGFAWRSIQEQPPATPHLVCLAVTLSALGPLARAIALSIFGQSVHGIVYRPGIQAILVEAGISYGLILMLWLGFSVFAALWAGLLQGSGGWRNGLTVSTYSSAPGWMCGLFLFEPRLAAAAAVGALYGVYVFYRGAQRLIVPQRGGALVYVACVLISYMTLAAALTEVIRRSIAAA